VGNNLYIYDLVYIYRRTPVGTLDIIAGSYSGLDHVVTGVPAKGSYLESVTSMTTDAQGNLYFSTGFGTAPSAVFSIQGGIINPVTGVNQANTAGFDGDAGTRLFQPGGMTFDANGNLYISDYNNHRVRRLSATGALTTIAGSRTLPNGSAAPAFRLGSTQAIAAAPDGSLYFADFPYAQVRKIQPNGSVTAVAGNGFTTPSGDGGPATSAGLGGSLNLIALDPVGNLDIHSFGTYRLRQVTPDGAIRTLAGNGVRTGPVGDVYAMAADATGAVYFSDYSMIRRTSGGLVTNVYPTSSGSMAISPSGAVYILGYQAVYRIDGDTLTRVAGTPNPKPGLVNDGLPATDAFLPFPSAIAFDHAGNLYISGQVIFQGPGAVWRVGSDGIQRRIAGPADGPESPDGTPSATAAFGVPYGMSVDSSGNVFLANISEIKVLVPDTGSGCTIRLASNAADVPAAGGDSSVGVTASLYFCPYSITAQAPWIEPALAGSSGNSSVAFHIDPNTGAARQGTVTIGALTFTVRQPGAPLAMSGASTLPAASAGAAYSTTLAATGGAPPYTWSLASGALPDGITLSPAGILAGTPASAGAFVFTARVTDSAAASASQAFTLTVSTTVSIDAVVNAAGALTGPIAPGELVVIYGKGLGSTQVSSDTAVLFDGISAPIIYTSPAQLIAVVPYSVSNARPQAVVKYKGAPSVPFPLTLSDAAHAIFTADSSGKGQAAALNEDGSYNDASHPAPTGKMVILFATGEGQTNPAGIDGKLAVAPFPKPVLPVTVTVGGAPSDVVYAGAAPGEIAGVMQLNIRIPTDAAPGNLPVVVQVGTALSRPEVTIAVSH
jgi:uncharacterized protein (TIGR03437 family)